jgi:hypothetical protein
MPLERLPLDQESAAATVDPNAAREYLLRTGWRLEPRLGRGITAVWERPEADHHQVQIPLTRNVSDFAPVMALAVSAIASWEGRPAVEVLDELMHFPADLLRARAAGGLDVEEVATFLDAVRTAGPGRVVPSVSPGWALTVACPIGRSRVAAVVMAALAPRACSDDNGHPPEGVEVVAAWSRTLPPPEGVPDVVALRREERDAVLPERPAPASAG